MSNATTGTIVNDEPKEELEVAAPEAEVTAPVEDTPEAPAEKQNIDDALEDAFAKYEENTKAEGAKPAADAPKGALPAGIKPAPPPPNAKPIDPITGRELEPIKAPYGIPLPLKDKWGTMDRDMQKYWSDREKHMQTTLQQVADERKVASEFKTVTAPFEPLFKQFNMKATDHVSALLSLSNELNTGTPQQKAATFVRLMNHFKPDGATMTQLFQGQQVNISPVNNPAQQQPQQPQRSPEQIEQDAIERHTVTNEVNSFINDPANEFAPYVHKQMAELITTNIVQGEVLADRLKHAYEIACNSHPDIRAALAARGQNAPTAHAAAPAVAAAPVAANTSTRAPIVGAKPSLASNGAARPGSKPKKGQNIDDVLNDAMAKHGIS